MSLLNIYKIEKTPKGHQAKKKQQLGKFCPKGG